jgi:hypothetical protein
MRGHHEFAGVRGAGQNAQTGDRRLLAILTEAAAVTRLEDLHRTVQHIADEHGTVRTGQQAKDRGAGSVAGSRFEAEVPVDTVAVVPQHTAFRYWRDAVGVDEAAAFPLAPLLTVAGGTAAVLAARIEILPIGRTRTRATAVTRSISTFWTRKNGTVSYVPLLTKVTDGEAVVSVIEAL